jgi:hypothetical protein
MKKLFVLYDAQSEFALRCYAWISTQSALLPLEFVPFQAAEQIARFPGVESFRGNEPLVVVSDEGAVYAGPNAFLMCLYALSNYQDWAIRLSAPALLPLAVRAFELFLADGKRIARLMVRLDDGKLLWLLQHQDSTSRAGPSP